MVRTFYCFAAFAASAFDRELFALAHVITPPKLVLCAGPDVPPTAARRAFTFVVFDARNSSPSIGTNPAFIGACHGMGAHRSRWKVARPVDAVIVHYRGRSCSSRKKILPDPDKQMVYPTGARDHQSQIR